MFNKRGVDAIVATVLIIMITVAAVAILWAFVIPMVKENLNSATAEKVSLSIETTGGYTTWDTVSEQATVQVSRGVDNANLTKVKITFFNGQDSYSVLQNAPASNTQATYKIPLIGFGKPIKVTVSPIFSDGKEGSVVGEVSNLVTNAVGLEWTAGEVMYNFTSGENITVPTNYNIHNCTTSYYDCNDWSWYENVPISCPSPSFCRTEDYPSWGWDCYYDLASLTAARCGGASVGASCEVDTDCFSNRCANDGGNYFWPPLCVEGNNGDYCDSASDCDSGICGEYSGHTCTSGDLGTGCFSQWECKEGSFCDNYNYFCSNGAVGDGCSDGSACASNFCNTYTHVCKADGSVGSGCSDGSACASNFCNTYTHVCKSDKTLGTGCGSHSECDSQYCNSATHLCAIPSLTSGLYLYFPFNETSGTSAMDYSGNARTGTLTSVGINKTGKVGRAYYFNGTTSYISRSIALGSNTPFAISFWTNMTGTINNGDFVLGRSSGAHPFHGINFNGAKFNLFRYYYNYNPTSAGSATANTWQNWVVTRNTSNVISIYLNGVQTGNYLASGEDIYYDYIGRGNFGWSADQYYGGMLDELTIWDRSLNSTEVLALYNLNNAGTQLK